MDSALGDDTTLPLDISYNPDMYMPSTSADVNVESQDQSSITEVPTSRKSDSTTSSLAPVLPCRILHHTAGTHTLVKSSIFFIGKDIRVVLRCANKKTAEIDRCGSHYISGRISPSSSRNMKDFATQISDLKKENFSLKLRIFYMEERMMEQFSGDHDQLWKTNIELKVECDSLRKELGEKHDLLVKASNAVACMDTGNGDEVRKAKLEAEREITQMRELMEEKVANAEKELQVAHQDSEQALEQAMRLKGELLNVQQENKDLNDALNDANQALEKAKQNRSEMEKDPDRDSSSASSSEATSVLQREVEASKHELEDKNRTITQLQHSLTTKQTLIEVLSEEKASMENEQVLPLTKEVEELKAKLKMVETSWGSKTQSDENSHQRYQEMLILHDEYQEHITEQQQRLDEFELATRRMSQELDKRQAELKDLKEALKDSEETVKNLTSKIDDDTHKSKDKQDKAAKDILKRDRAVTALTMAARKKEDENRNLTREIEELKLQVDSLKLDNDAKDSMLAELKKAKSAQVDASPSKDSLIQQLRDQLKESDTALQQLKERKSVPMHPAVRNKSTQSDSFHLQEQDQETISELKRKASLNEVLLMQLRQQLLVSETALQQLREEKDFPVRPAVQNVSTQSDRFYLRNQDEETISEQLREEKDCFPVRPAVQNMSTQSDSFYLQDQETISELKRKASLNEVLLMKSRQQLLVSEAALQQLREEKLSPVHPAVQNVSTQSESFYLQEQDEELISELKRKTSVNEVLLLQLRQQLLVSEAAVQSQQFKAQQIQAQLKEADSNLQMVRTVSCTLSSGTFDLDALDERSRFEEERDKNARDLNQRIREQNRQIERLKSQVASSDETLASLEDCSKEKDWEVQDLNTKYKNLLKEKQELMDAKNRVEDEHERYVRDSNQQSRENNRQIDRLKSQINDFEESVASLDSRIKEKDWQLQELATKHKNLLKDLQVKEEECMRAVLERDELVSQCEEEKNRFSSLAGKMLRRTGSEASSRIEMEALSRVRELEDELFKKNQALTEATLARDRAEREENATRRELEDAFCAHERENDENSREIGLRDVEIRKLQDMLRETEDKMHECDSKMQVEINKLVRQNSDLREKLRSSEEELTHLKPKRSKQGADEKSKLINKDLFEEMNDLRRELNKKDEEIKKLRLDIFHHVPDEDTSKVGRNVTFTDRASSPQKKTNGFNSSNQSSSYGDESDYDVTISDMTGDEQTTPALKRLRKVHEKNRRGNMTIDTTLGLPLDETSYMSIVNGGYHGNDDVSKIDELKRLLSDTRKQLSDAVHEINSLKQTSSDHISKIQLLEQLVEEKTVENRTLMDEYNKVNRQKKAKELEVHGLSSRLRKDDSNIKQHFIDVDALRNDSATESDNVSLSARSRLKSGEESDGMSSLNRKELCETISNLKKKLCNVEKVNDLLTQQINDVSKAETQAGENVHLVTELTAEVQRLKSELDALNELREADRESPSRTSLRLIPSKLPLPKNFKGQNKPVNLRPELERARMLNKKLNERLAATEQTVRMQADKLNRCRAAMQEAGISSPPLSPLRAARSVPDLHLPSELYATDPVTKNETRERSRSTSTDTNDASTQTRDSGISSLSDNSEQRFNSLIQAQAKELSLLREQLKKSRETCKHLQTEMDMLSRYLSVLSATESFADPSVTSGIEQEIERSKKLVAKLRKNLKENMDEVLPSDAESDSSAATSPLPPPVHEIHQLERLRNELKNKDNEINDLKMKIDNLETAMISQTRDRNRLNVGTMHPSEKWSSTPNLHPQYSSTFLQQGYPSPTSVLKKKPSSLGSPYKSRNEHGLLTPGSSHLSLHSASEDEIKLLHDDSSRLPTRFGDPDDRYASLPDHLDKPQRSSWPNDHGHVTSNSQPKRRSMPMYQRTIAVTEYLPPNKRSDRGESYSAASDPDESSQQRRLLLSSDASRCSASYGGQWAKNPQKLTENQRPNGRNKSSPWESTRLDVGDSSCDEVQGDRNHKLAREVDRLRRRLTDTKRINRSLKEELDLANKSLIRTKDSMVPGYQRSPHHDAELLAEHLNEIRGLRQRLEHSIATNDRLREKLENRLKDTSVGSKEHLSANIYVSPPKQGSPADSSHIRNLEKKVEKLEDENEKLRKRLQAEEKAHSTYEEAVREMKALQHHLVEKSDKNDRLTEHVQRLQYELKQQNNMSDTFGEKLRLQDADLSEYKQKLEKVQSEKEKLIQDNKKAYEAKKQMWSEVENSRYQLDECRQLIDSLKSELALYEKLQIQQSTSSCSPVQLDLSELLEEIRSLRIELEKSIEANAALRNQLEEQLRSPHGRDDSALTTINIHHMSPRSSSKETSSSSNRPSPLSVRRKLKLGASVESENVLMTPPASASSGGEEHNFTFDPVDTSQSRSLMSDSMIRLTTNDSSSSTNTSNKEKPFYSRGGPYTLCKSDDFLKLQQTLAKSGLVARTADNKVMEIINNIRRSNNTETKIFRELSKSTSSLCLLLDDGDVLLRMFWPALIPYPHTLSTVDTQGRFSSTAGVAAGPLTSSISVPTIKRQLSDAESSVTSETDGLRREVGRLRRRLSTQDRLLQSTVDRLHNTNRLKEGIENAIVKQLSKTHDVLRKARGNLEQAHDSGKRSFVP